MTGRMRIRDLEFVVAAYEVGNLTLAAKRFSISEPAFSKQLKKIERCIQTPLFERDNGGVVPTASGRAFVAHAVDCIQAFRRAVHDAHEMKYGNRHKLRIGASSFLSRAWIELLCSVELHSHRDFNLEVLGGYSLDLLSQLQHHEIDLALVTSPPPTPAITTLCVAKSPFMIVMQRSHPLASRESVLLNDVARYPWIFFNRNVHSYLHDQILHRIETDGYHIRVLHQIGQAEQASVLLTDNDLVAWLTPAGAERIMENDLVSMPLLDAEIRLETHLVTLADNKSPLVSEYVRTLVTKIEEQRSPLQLPLPIESTDSGTDHQR